ncbi:MAG: 2-methylcitrate dehydratase [Nitrospirae bacterium]|nr:MAG: 2-methylcitrate dehydratase [Nitrospira sp. OLB3]MBV6469856.1 2-methylcitrate dehydratase [Nitrospirota bacterium]MCE7964461.1 MmgE/PrpD family protein [Nitrospira sp. NTP2]MCK6492397.1 MmgE/PrpD family protein [Nitrospira sp.]MEB2340078.1 MmgE/PrpD family protein [Nitrospirales bacterium]
MLADRLARYGRALCYDDLPSAVVQEVKRRILDSLACAFGAWNAPPCKIARDLARTVPLPGGATLWGTVHRTLPDLATFANGALVRYLDFNDTYLSKEPAHPSDNIAAVLAAGEVAHASGARVIQAVALAYEIHCRLCDAAALRPRGWDHVTYGSLSSALGVAKVMKLSESQTEQAVNLAGVANVALRQTRIGDLSMWKACAFSNAARNGLFAALLAQRGMTGPAPIFEGEKGFMKLVSGPFTLPQLGGERSDAQEPAPFKILDTYIKHFPVEYHAQTAVEAALALRQTLLAAEGEQAIAQLKDVEIGSYDVAIEIIGRDQEKWRPATRETADHSFPYCVAVALCDGRVTLHSFSTRRLQDQALHRLMQRIRVVERPEFVGCYPGSMPTRITAQTGSGQSYVAQVDLPSGHPAHPLTDQEVEEKFRRLAARRLTRPQMDRLINRIWKLERERDIAALMPLLATGKG